jgi:hypothetical protein
MGKLDKVAALADTSDLGSFDGQDVLRTTIAVTHAGDGLSNALAVEPRMMHLGDKVVVVLECEVVKVVHRPLDADTPHGPLLREHTLKAGTATIIDEAATADLASKLKEQAERIKLAQEQADGIQRLRGVDGGDVDGEVETSGLDVPEPEWTDAELAQKDLEDEALDTLADQVAEADELRAKRSHRGRGKAAPDA